MTAAHGNNPGMSGYEPLPHQPFHTDHDPDLGALVDDFLAELDHLLRPSLERKTRQAKKAGKP